MQARNKVHENMTIDGHGDWQDTEPELSLVHLYDNEYSTPPVQAHSSMDTHSSLKQSICELFHSTLIHYSNETLLQNEDS